VVQKSCCFLGSLPQPPTSHSAEVRGVAYTVRDESHIVGALITYSSSDAFRNFEKLDASKFFRSQLAAKMYCYIYTMTIKLKCTTYNDHDKCQIQRRNVLYTMTKCTIYNVHKAALQCVAVCFSCAAIVLHTMTMTCTIYNDEMYHIQ